MYKEYQFGGNDRIQSLSQTLWNLTFISQQPPRLSASR